jgi:hypothetical protein
VNNNENYVYIRFASSDTYHPRSGWSFVYGDTGGNDSPGSRGLEVVTATGWPTFWNPSGQSILAVAHPPRGNRRNQWNQKTGVRLPGEVFLSGKGRRPEFNPTGQTDFPKEVISFSDFSRKSFSFLTITDSNQNGGKRCPNQKPHF